MKILKSITSMIMVCCMLLTSSLAVNAASEEKLEIQTAFLTALGVENVSTSTASASATRGDAAKYLAQAIGMSGDYKATEEIFSDVPVDSSYASAVAYLHSLEIINGNSDGTFRPDANITYGEFVKMAVSALGYKDYASYKGGWTRGYIDCARSAGILTGVSESATFNKGSIYTILYNMLHANRLIADEVSIDPKTGEASVRYNKGNVYMKDLFGITKYEGIVTASATGSIRGSEVMTDDTIKIDYKSYSLLTPTAGDYAGYSVEYYLNENGDVQFVIPKENVVYTVSHDKILNPTTSNFEYEDENENRKTLKIASDAYYTYNGVEFFPHNADLKPAYGRVVLIDNNNDKKIDVVKVIDYKNYFIKAVSDTKFYLDDNSENKYYIDYEKDYDQVIFMNSVNEVIDPLLIAQKSVISVAVSKGNELCTITMSNDVLEGTLTTITSDNKATIDDYEYTIYNNVDLDDYFGKYAMFYLDVDGAIVKVELEKEEKYAVLQGVMLAGKSKDELKVRFYDTGKYVEYDCTPKVQISQDGGQTFVTKKNEDAYSIIKPLYDADTKQLVQYTLKDGKMNKLIFADNAIGQDPNKDIFQLNKKSMPNKEYKPYREFLSNSTEGDYIRYNPRNSYVYIIGNTERTCSYGTIEDILTENTSYNNFKAYDMSESYVTKYIVIDAAIETMPNVEWNGSDVAFIVSDKTVVGEDGEPIHVYEALCSKTNGAGPYKATLKTSKTDLFNTSRADGQGNSGSFYQGNTINFQDLKPGYVIQYTKNNILDEVSGFVILSKPEDLATEKSGTYTGANINSVTVGTVVNVDDMGCTVTNSTMPVNPFGKNEAILTRCSVYPIRDLVAKWDVANQKMTLASWDDIVPGMKLWNYTQTTYSFYGRWFIIIEE